jgi:hypothetical protein
MACAKYIIPGGDIIPEEDIIFGFQDLGKIKLSFM